MKKLHKLDWNYLWLGIIMSIFYGHIQWNNFIGDPDGFYHAKLAKWLSEGKIIHSLPWMQFSSINDNFTDHHLLYHLLLAPFTIFFDPLISVKIATVIFSVTMVLGFYWLIKKMYIPYPFWISTGFLLLNGLNFRVSLIKVNSLSILMLWLITYAFFAQKHWLALLLGFLFVWLYAGWPLAILLLISYILSVKIDQHIHTNKFKIFWHKTISIYNPKKRKRPLLKISSYLLIGLTLGILINPYWPQNLSFYYQQFLQIGVINMGNKFGVGAEWYGVGIGNIISSAPHLFIAACFSVLILFLNIKKISRLSWFSFILAFSFLLLTVKSRRYIEYYMPLTLLFVASSIKDIKTFLNLSKIKKIWHSLSKILKAYLLIIMTVFISLIMPSTYDKILNVNLPKKYNFEHFQGASQWLADNTPKNSIIFHSDWDEWPMLFYQNDQNYYIIGLDPTFMENYDGQLHKLYSNITIGKIDTDLNNIIKQSFNANYVFVENKGHEKLIKNLNTDPNNIIVYQDNISIIYQLN